VVLPQVGNDALPHRRYLVADRDRRHPDHPAARRHPPQARLGHPSLLWRATGPGGQPAEPCWRARAKGNLVITQLLAGADAHRVRRSRALRQTYFSTFPGKYFTGDGARRDEDGYYWITGRVDDVLNVSGHRLGTAEIESALVAMQAVAEAAVVGLPARHQGSGHLRLRHPHGRHRADRRPAKGTWWPWVRKEIGPIAIVDLIQWAPGLPKTRSGKIMRRILRKIAANEIDSLGDTSTLADPVNELIENRANQ
jgi:acetyl-CoA synthetase